MHDTKECGLDVDERRAIIEQLEEILKRLDKGGESMAAINIDLALNLLIPERSPSAI